ncbi:unnamed protein product [Penicillium manginii]
MSDKFFAGYRWNYFASLADETLRSRVQNFIDSIDWELLIEYAVNLRDKKRCKLLPDIGLGLNHVVRIIEFDDNVRWIARLRMESRSGNQADTTTTNDIMSNEYNAILLVKQKTKILIPSVHAVELSPDNAVNAKFMLMDCLKGNVGMDLGMEIPDEHKDHVYRKMADVQLELSRVQLPKIGAILRRNNDGTFEQGPIPGLGGPFETATEFFSKWAEKVEFGLSEAKLRKAAGSLADELAFSASSFRSLVKIFAEKLSVRDNGPFPLCHGDFGHNNMVFDDKYNLLGVIDWEAAFAGPWEIFAEFPLSLSTVPPDMDAAWNYDENGVPKDAQSMRRNADRQKYISAVMEKERDMDLPEGYRLSMALKDSRRQALATAMRLYERGKPGWYAKVIEKFNADFSR